MKRLLLAIPIILLCGFTYGYKNNTQTGKPDLVVTGVGSSDITTSLGYTPMKTDYSNAGAAPTWNQNTTGSAAKWTTGRTVSMTGDVTYTSPTIDGSGNVTAAATVNGKEPTITAGTTAQYWRGDKSWQTLALIIGAKVGSFTRLLSAVSGNVSYTGIGFKPSAIIFFSGVDTVNEISLGFTTSTESRSISKDSSGANTSGNRCIRIVRPSAGNISDAYIASMDSDGFTLTWTTTGSPSPNDLVINYLAIR